jgi:hypothetical protein
LVIEGRSDRGDGGLLELEGKDFVTEFLGGSGWIEARVVVEVAGEPVGAFAVETANDGSGSADNGFDFGVLFGLAAEALIHDFAVRGGERDSVFGDGLPFVAGVEEAAGVPSGQEVPGEVVVQVDQAGIDDVVAFDDDGVFGNRDVNADGLNIASGDEDSSPLDDLIGRDDDATERDGGSLSVG